MDLPRLEKDSFDVSNEPQETCNQSFEEFVTSFGLKSPEQTQDEADLEDQKFDHALDAIK